MRNVNLPLPELFAIAGTRAALGVGIGLLLADQLDREQRHWLGWGLLALGALSTIPLASDVLSHRISRSSSSMRPWNRLMESVGART